jgi:hypothetical protein
VGPFAEDVLIREGRETEYSAEQEEQINVDVQGNLLDETNQGRLDGRFA